MPQAAQPKETPTADSAESLIFGILDRLTDQGHCIANIVVAPATANGSPDWENANPTNLACLYEDNWPEDELEERRVAVLVDDIDGCDPDTSLLVFLREGLQPSIQQIAGPQPDADVAAMMIARDIGAAPTVRPQSKLVASMEKLAASLAKPVAANDNSPPAIVNSPRLERLQREHGGNIIDGTIYGVTIGKQTGRVSINADGAAVLQNLHGQWVVSETRPLRATRFSLGDPTAIAQREWLWGSHYMRKYLTMTVGAGGGGKSANAVSETLAMVSGHPLLDPEGPFTKPLKVWYVNAEDPVDEIQRRFAGAAIRYGVKDGHIEGRLFTDSGRDQEFVIVRQEGRDFKVVEPMVEDMLAVIRENEIDVVIVDPFVSTHEVPENDNGLVQRVAKAWRRVADQGNCGVELIHHVTKGNAEITADSARGGSALKDASRSVRVINPMTKEEAERANVDSAAGYFRIDFGKVNMLASTSSSWRHFVSVPLGNGTGLVKTGDKIGVVEPWSWPSKSEAVAFVKPEELAAIKRKIGGTNCRDSVQAGDWAGYKVAEALEINLTDPAEKKRVQRMLDAWKADGHFTIEQRPDHKGTPRPCLVPIFPTSKFRGGEVVGEVGRIHLPHHPHPYF